MATTLRPGGIDEKSGWGILDPACVKHRVWIAAAVLLLAFLGLLARLWFLQIAEGASFLAQAERNRVRRVPLPAPRGLILDRNGKVLATSRAAHSIAVIPAALPSRKSDPQERAKVLRTLGYLLKTSPAEIERDLDDALDPHKGHAQRYDPIHVADGADLKTITLVEENKPRLGPAVLVTDEITRYYPNGSFAAHVLGYTGIASARDIEKSEEEAAHNPKARKLRFDDTVGVNGVEREYDALLAGTPGSALYEVDARLQPTRRLETIPEKAGNTLVLTLDSKIQKAAEDALSHARNAGAAVAVDVRSGEVLALASNPTYDPNIFSLPRRDPRRTREINRIFETNLPEKRRTKKYLYNRAVTSHYAPGSTFKMVTGAAGLEKGAITPSTTFTCSGGLRLGRWFGCWGTHGAQNLYGAYAESCDVYFYQTALRLGNPESSGPTYLAQIARQFGLGSKTGIDLPTDGAGLIPDPDWRRRINKTRPDLAHWYPGNTLNMSIGQGDVLATPLQMALVTAAVANGGTLWKPHLMKAVRDRNGKALETSKPQGKSVGIRPGYLAAVRRGMRQVVTSGTGRGVALPQVTVAGKTGSAEDDNHGLPHAWWVCFAPYENPRVAIAVIIENSGHGSENAGPVAKEMLEAAFPVKKQANPG
jgi:penicillin-binding protein 2